MDHSNSIRSSAILHDSIVTIKLEGEATTYALSKALLVEASQYFAQALGGDFRESKSQVLTLPGCNATTFKLFAHFLYRQNLPLEYERSSNDQEDGEESCRYKITTDLLMLWEFADERLLTHLHQSTLDCIVAQQRMRITPIDTRLVVVAWEISAHDSDLCKLLVGMVAFDQETDRVREPDDIEALHALDGFSDLMAARVEAMVTEKKKRERPEWSTEEENPYAVFYDHGRWEWDMRFEVEQPEDERELRRSDELRL
jgi:hypothetical protein